MSARFDEMRRTFVVLAAVVAALACGCGDPPVDQPAAEAGIDASSAPPLRTLLDVMSASSALITFTASKDAPITEATYPEALVVPNPARVTFPSASGTSRSGHNPSSSSDWRRSSVRRP